MCLKHWLRNGGLFVLLLVLTFYMVLKENQIGKLVSAFDNADKKYLLAGVLAMVVFNCGEALNIARGLRVFDYRITPVSAIKYALTGFFFSGVTPSASGGQPMQVYTMHQDNIKVAHGTLALLFELLSSEIVTALLAVCGYLFQREVIASNMGSLRLLLVVGLLVSIITMILLVCAIFSKKAITILCSFAVKLVNIFSPSRTEAVSQKLTEQISEYQKSARYFKENKKIFFKNLVTSLVQILALYSIPFMVYKSFGLNQYNWAEAVSLQAVLYVAVAALPLPGALSVSESGFMMLFKTMFPAGLLGSAMILSRGISFYLFVLISGLSVAVFSLAGQKVNRERKKESGD